MPTYHAMPWKPHDAVFYSHRSYKCYLLYVHDHDHDHETDIYNLTNAIPNPSCPPHILFV